MQRFIETLAEFVLAAIGLQILVDSAVKGFILIAAVCVAILWMWRTSAASRHFAWIVGIVGLLVLPFLSAVMPQWRILPTWTELAVEKVPGTDAEVRIGPFEPVLVAPSEMRAARINEESLSTKMSGSEANVTVKARAKSGASRDEGTPIVNWALAIWLSGVGLLFLRLLVCQGGLFILKLRTRPAIEGALADHAQTLSRQLRIKSRVAFLISDRRAIPMTWGIVRPHVLVPAVILTWPADQQKAILLHELAHVRRQDCLSQLVTQLACALHWFNPLVWVAAWRIEIERERACDDVVLSSGFGAPDYAELVLNIGSTFTQSVIANTASLAMARPSGLESRLRTILDSTRNRAKVRRWILVLWSLVFVAALLPISMMRAVEGQTPDVPIPSQRPSDSPSTSGPASESPRGEIHGTILDTVTGAPVVGAYVGVGDFGDSGGSNFQRHREQGLFDSARTDANGHFTLTGLIHTDKNTGLDAHLLIVTQSGYLPHRSEVSLPPGETPRVEVQLSPAASAHVQVVDSAGNLQKGVFLLRIEALDGHEFLPASGDPHLSAFASSSWMEWTRDGEFKFEQLRPGAYQVDVLEVRSIQRQPIEGYGGPVLPNEGTRYHGGIASLDLQAGRTVAVQIAPQDFGTRLVLALPDVAGRGQVRPDIYSKPFVVITRNPRLLVWSADKYRSPEDPRVGRIQKNALLWGLSDVGKQFTIDNLPPGRYAAFSGPFNALQGVELSLNRNAAVSIDIGWTEPDAISQIGVDGLQNAVTLDRPEYSAVEFFNLLSKATDGRPVLQAEPGIGEARVRVAAGRIRIWELLEAILHDEVWKFREAEGNTLVVGRSQASVQNREN